VDQQLEANKELVRRHFEEIFNDHRFEVADEIMADDYIENGAAPFQNRAPGRANGPESTRRTAQWLLGAFPDLQIEIQQVIAEGDLVAARSIMRGTYQSNFMGIPPTGQSFEATRTDVFRVSEGRLAEHWANRDDLTMMVQIGIARPPENLQR
jgi:steroid delta-isomerase-like uncharacterized protein